MTEAAAQITDEIKERNEENETNQGTTKQRRKKMILVVAVFTLAGIIAIVVVVLLPGKNEPTGRLDDNNNLQGEKLQQDQQKSPTISPTTYSYPPQHIALTLGCRGDRFDNEGNSEGNNRLYTGQFVCSDDDDQRYHFGLEHSTGNLIWYDTFTNHTKTYYTNDYAPVSSIISPPTVFILDYYFSMSIEGSFQIYRLEGKRTNDSNVIEKLHWELPSLYNISNVYENCLKTHDCPYLHLHQDGVIVLAWLDFALSEYWDGWMEKNIRRCYDFPTTDEL